MHTQDVSLRELALACLFIDERPFGTERTRLLDSL